MQQSYFKKNLNFLVKNTTIRQSDLSKILGVTRQAIHNMMVNDSDIRLSTALKIADAFGIDAKDLLFVDLEEKLKNKKITYKLNISDDEEDA